MESKYFIHEHPLIFLENLKVDGENEVVCEVCEEPTSGPGYKCSDCNVLCHESCFQLPEEIQHPLHPNHTLCIESPSGNYYCFACGKRSERCFFYRCMQRDCNFNLDTKCASRWRASKDECHHAYVPLLKQIQFTCEACGKEGKDIGDNDEGIGLLCSKCRLLIHVKCASLSRTIKIWLHDHLLTLTYSILQVMERADILCKLCRKEVNTKHAIYYCHKCSYATHLKCAEEFEDDEIIESAPIGSIVNITSLFKDINRVENERGMLQEIKHHFSHQHDLILNYDEVKDDKMCDGCMQLISPPFYSCAPCNFSLHNICAKLPTNARHSIFPFSFTLMSKTLSSDGVFKCCICEQYRHGFAYCPEIVRAKIDMDKENIDIQCFAIQETMDKENIDIQCFAIQETMDKVNVDIQCFAIQETLHHEGHQHPLLLAAIFKGECKFCKNPNVFVCYPCNFTLCFRCATLPLLASHKYDEHPLKLTYTAEDRSGEYYCLICEEERDQDHWFYYCETCEFSTHPKCAVGKYPYIKFGKTYKDEHHQHPFTFVRKTEYSPPCDVCNDHFDEIALECTQCKLTVHPRFGFPEGYDCLQNLDEAEEAERDEDKEGKEEEEAERDEDKEGKEDEVDEDEEDEEAERDENGVK